MDARHVRNFTADPKMMHWCDPPDVCSYDEQWNHYANVITGAVQSGIGQMVKFQGATFCCNIKWFQYLPAFIFKNADRLATISVHSYPLAVCSNNTVTLAELLNTKHTAPDGRQLDGLVAAREKGVQYWLAETNSVACGGSSGVSDTFGAALWAIDWMFNGAALGYHGMNFHGAGSGAAYAPWKYPTHSETPLVMPLYYAMLAFARTIAGPSAYLLSPGGSSPLRVEFSSGESNATTSVWSVSDAATSARKIIVNNRDIGAGARDIFITVKLTHGSWHAEAALTTLEAQSAYSTSGVRLAGQTFDGTRDGRILGDYHVQRVPATSPNEWRFRMKAGSTAFLTVCAPSDLKPCSNL